MSDAFDTPSIRLDRWLWAARAYLSRSQAAAGCDAGRVTVNGALAKPHKLVRAGDEVGFPTPAGKRVWKVVQLASRRGPASIARTLYEDVTPAAPPPEPSMPQRERGGGRPTKRERRRMERFLG
ncbi:MAG: RNA-binding S4 domain-containing protein [Candidatus Binatia bacterium]